MSTQFFGDWSISGDLVNRDPFLKIMKSSLNTPVPTNLSFFWGVGSILTLCLLMQIITGLFLSFQYSNTIANSFESVAEMLRSVNFGWNIKNLHCAGASSFFLFVYIHIGRGLYFSSFFLKKIWVSGTVLLFALMATAFLGYVLPWGQMSYWGATVITNLLSTIPQIGPKIVLWLWGGFSVENPTLNRFYSIHFLMPLIMIMLVLVHFTYLHQTGSSNPLGVLSCDKISFHPHLSYKDLVGFSGYAMALLSSIFFFPELFGDPENFSAANPLITPNHIQPEWYYLFAYAILRAIPSKLGGVLALLSSVSVLIILPVLARPQNPSSFKPQKKFFFWGFVVIFLMLTWLGAKPVEDPFIFMSKVFTLLYFLFFFSYL